MTAPASRNFLAMALSRGTVAPSRDHDPAVLFMESLVAMLFLIKIGMPCSGLLLSQHSDSFWQKVMRTYPRLVPFSRSRSSSAAIACASGLSSVTTFSVLFTSSMRLMYAFIYVSQTAIPVECHRNWIHTWTRSTLVYCPLSRPATKDSTVASISVGIATQKSVVDLSSGPSANWH